MEEILSFRSSSEFRKWLAANHRQSDGIWLRILKKESGEPSVTHAEALQEALCFGWIDGQKQRHDDSSWLQRFTRRRPKSGWSKINTQHAERLMRAGRMKPAGQTEMPRRRTAAGQLPTIPPAKQPFLRVFWRPCAGTGKRKHSSSRSIKRTATRLPTGCKRQRNRKRNKDVWK